MDFRHSNGIASGFTVRSDLRISDSGYVTTSEAAAALGISVSTVENWFKQGILDGKRDKAGATIWIAWSEEVAYRLSGGATPDPRMVTIRLLCKARDQTPAEILQWAKWKGYQIHRLRRGKAFKFYVSPAESSARP